MPSLQGPTPPRLMDDLASFESSQEWSIYKANAVLDSQSFYDDSDLFNSNSAIGFSQISEIPPKLIKTEPLDELVPAEFQHIAWQSKCIDYWQPQDCLFWLISEMQELKVARALPEVKMEKIAHIDGLAIKNMSLDEFRWMFPNYGDVLYNRLQKYKSSVNNYYSFDQWHTAPLQRDENFAPPPEAHTLTDLDIEPHQPSLPPTFPTTSLPYCSPSTGEVDSGYKSDSSEESIPEPPPPEKRRPGRPRGTRKKKKPEKLGRLWEFIRDLLLNPLYNPSLICWENYDEGTFRFVHSDKVAKLWGSKKDNGDMNYEKLSRAMRYYYKSQVLLPVYGKRLVYKFGPTATGWRSDRPIFRQA